MKNTVGMEHSCTYFGYPGSQVWALRVKILDEWLIRIANKMFSHCSETMVANESQK